MARFLHVEYYPSVVDAFNSKRSLQEECSNSDEWSLDEIAVCYSCNGKNTDLAGNNYFQGSRNNLKVLINSLDPEDQFEAFTNLSLIFAEFPPNYDWIVIQNS